MDVTALGLQTIEVAVNGVTPMLQHNIRLADPLDPITRELKNVSAKKSKTDADLLALRDLEMRGGVYWDEHLGVYVPDDWLEAAIIGGAKKKRAGPAAKAGVQVISPIMPLEYAGKSRIQTLDDLVNSQDNAFTKGVNVSGKRVMRCRPIFHEWSFEATIAYDPDILNKETLVEWMETAGIMLGLGDWRPKFGRFTVGVL